LQLGGGAKKKKLGGGVFHRGMDREAGYTGTGRHRVKNKKKENGGPGLPQNSKGSLPTERGGTHPKNQIIERRKQKSMVRGGAKARAP